MYINSHAVMFLIHAARPRGTCEQLLSPGSQERHNMVIPMHVIEFISARSTKYV